MNRYLQHGEVLTSEISILFVTLSKCDEILYGLEQIQLIEQLLLEANRAGMTEVIFKCFLSPFEKLTLDPSGPSGPMSPGCPTEPCKTNSKV